MDEPVELRLRDIAGDGTCLGDDVAEAMDELDDLRARVDEGHRARDVLIQANEQLQTRLAAAETEAERLREALARMTGYRDTLAERCYRKDLELDELRPDGAS